MTFPLHRPQTKLQPQQNDITWSIFGHLQVVAYRGKAPKTRNSMWLCLCSCGQTKDMVRYQDLMQGKTKSCGGCNQRKKPSTRKTKPSSKHQDFA